VRAYLERCHCGSGHPAYPEYDGHDIFLFYACDKCRKKKLSKYRPDILERYRADEPLDDE